MPSSRLQRFYNDEIPYQIPPFIDGRGNNLPILMLICIVLMPFVTYYSVVFLELGIIETNAIFVSYVWYFHLLSLLDKLVFIYSFQL